MFPQFCRDYKGRTRGHKAVIYEGTRVHNEGTRDNPINNYSRSSLRIHDSVNTLSTFDYVEGTILLNLTQTD